MSHQFGSNVRSPIHCTSFPISSAAWSQVCFKRWFTRAKYLFSTAFTSLFVLISARQSCNVKCEDTPRIFSKECDVTLISNCAASCMGWYFQIPKNPLSSVPIVFIICTSGRKTYVAFWCFNIEQGHSTLSLSCCIAVTPEKNGTFKWPINVDSLIDSLCTTGSAWSTNAYSKVTSCMVHFINASASINGFWVSMKFFKNQWSTYCEIKGGLINCIRVSCECL